jgi:Rps23 Pro-64 3,4-dihydroxylase Tpa1-like proline 4-hydroxylase
MFRLNPDLDLDTLAEDYAALGRVRIHGLLDQDGVAELYRYLHGNDGWWHLMIGDGGIIELDRAKRARMSAKRRAALDAEVHARAVAGFQYRYEGLRVPDREDLETDNDPLTEFARLMSSEPMLDMLRKVTGASELAFTDGQATAYGPGDFLTGHDDDVPGKNRLAAYVFGMTPRWRTEWGGLLLFHGADESTVTGHVPRFNTLDLFKVPQRHSVSIVTPAAPCRRYAVTGWLRSGQR